MTYIHLRTVRLSETDATGILYFTNLFKYGTEAFEDLLCHHYSSLEELEVFLPIVHAGGDFLAPLVAGDEIEVHLHVLKLGTTSLTLTSNIVKEKEALAKIEIVHVAINKKTKEKCALPERLRDLLAKGF